MGKNHPNVDDYVISRVRALESLLLEKGLLAPDAVDRVIRRYEASIGPMLGARAVSEPRQVLTEFGLVVPTEREICVWDSSAELRYMVLPMAPAGAARLDEDAL